jgi:hypothetical protein
LGTGYTNKNKMEECLLRYAGSDQRSCALCFVHCAFPDVFVRMATVPVHVQVRVQVYCTSTVRAGLYDLGAGDDSRRRKTSS